jgi:cell division septation protein DedD
LNTINRHICDLLYEHDCVIVPDLGGFLASYHGAVIHPLQHTITPPSRRVAFNIYLRQNDGLLANRLSSALQVTYPEAVKQLVAYVDGCQHELRSGRHVNLEGIGSLYSQGDKILFEPLPSANFLADSFGLSTLQHIGVVREQETEKQLRNLVTIRPSVKPERTSATPKRKGQLLSRIAIAGAVLWMGVNIFLVVKNNRETLVAGNNSKATIEQQASAKQEVIQANKESVAAAVSIPETMAIGQTPEPSPITPQEQIQEPAKEQAPEVNIPSKNFSEQDIQAGVKTAVSAMHQQTMPATISETNKFFVIAGAFAISSNADALLSTLQKEGFSNASIIPSYGKLTLVAYGSYARRHEALQALDSIRKENNEGWIMKK